MATVRKSDSRPDDPPTTRQALFQIGNTAGGRLRYRTGVAIAYSEKKMIERRERAKSAERHTRADKTVKKYFGNY